MPYTRTTWANGSAPALNATNLNNVEAGITAALGGVFNVIDYGAVGNDSTDNTTAFANAITAALRSDITATSAPYHHCRVVVPPGIYRVQKIDMWSTDSHGVWLDAPNGGVIIKGTSDGQNVINIRGNDCTITRIAVMRVAGHTTGHGISIAPTTDTTLLRLRLTDVLSRDHPQDGISCDRLEHGTFINVTANTNGRYGFRLFNGTATFFGFQNTFIGCSARNSGSTGFYSDAQQNSTLINFEALNNNPSGGSSGVQIRFDATQQSSAGHTVINADVENFSGDKAGRGIQFIGSGNTVIGGSGWELHTGVYLNSSGSNTIHGFRCSRSGSLAGSSVVFADSASNNNHIDAPAGANMANQTSTDAAALGNVVRTAEQLELRGARITGAVRTLTVNSTTPSIQNSDWFTTANSSATSITSFTNVGTRTIQVLINDANTTFVNGANLKMAGSVNWAAPNGARVSFACFSGVAYEISRTLA